MKNMNKRALGYVFILITAIIFSSAEPIFKSVAGIFHPMQFTATRFFFGGLILLPIALKELKNRMLENTGSEKIAIPASDWVRIVFVGVLNTTVSMTTYQLALSHIPASVAAVLLASNPIVTVFLANWILKEPIKKNNIITVIFTIIGVAFIIAPWNVVLPTIGLVLMVVTITTFSLYSVLGKKVTNKYGGLAVNSLSGMAGGIVSFLIMSLTNIPAVSDFFTSQGLGFFASIPFFQGYTANIMLRVIWIWFFNTGIGFLCYFKGMEYTSAIEGSFVFLIKIFLGPIFSMITLKEVITNNMWLGMLCVFIGSIFGVYPGIRALIEERKQVELSSNSSSI